MSDVIYGIGLIVLAIVLIVAGPLVTIWSLNTLFNLGIPMNLATWFATLWLGAALKARVYTKDE